jgi:hypothetical protein
VAIARVCRSLLQGLATRAKRQAFAEWRAHDRRTARWALVLPRLRRLLRRRSLQSAMGRWRRQVAAGYKVQRQWERREEQGERRTLRHVLQVRTGLCGGRK